MKSLLNLNKDEEDTRHYHPSPPPPVTEDYKRVFQFSLHHTPVYEFPRHDTTITADSTRGKLLAGSKEAGGHVPASLCARPLHKASPSERDQRIPFRGR